MKNFLTNKIKDYKKLEWSMKSFRGGLRRKVVFKYR